MKSFLAYDFQKSFILYEDNHIIVINKKSSEIVQSDKTGDKPIIEFIKDYIKEKYNKPGNVFCGLVHRLDRPTSGAIVFARTSKALSRLNQQFRNRSINKVYWAVVEKKPNQKSAKLRHYLKKNIKQNKSYAFDKHVNGSKEAILNYNWLASSDNYHLLEITLETGRHHQIRCQLAQIGCIIKGDVKYGAKRANSDYSIHLHARKLIFEHPTKKEIISIIAPVPNDTLWKHFKENISF